MTALFALLGAVIVGASDFGGGIAARQVSPFRVTAWIQGVGFATLLIAVWFIDAPVIRSVDLGAGVIAGLSGTFSFVALYAAFSRGQISLLAPVAAVVSAVLPTFVGSIRGETLRALQIVGIVLSLVAVTLVSQQSDDDEAGATPPIAFGLAALAGLGFSVFFLALAETSPDAGLWPLVVARASSVPIVAVVALFVTSGLAMPTPSIRKIVVAAGVAEAFASVLALWAFQRGPIAVAAVLGAFYPLSTVMLARFILDERLQRLQWIGVAITLLAIPLVAFP